MSDNRKYSRLYHEAVDDRKFRDVWGDDACLALWVRLLVAADASWPSSAAFPRSVKKRALGVLVAARLVDVHPDGDHYRIHGLDAERSRRSDAASYAADVRWHTNGNADSNADRIADGTAGRNADLMPSKDETSKRLAKELREVTRADEAPRLASERTR